MKTRLQILSLIIGCAGLASAQELDSKAVLSSFLASLKAGKHQEASQLVFSPSGAEAATQARVKMLSAKSMETGQSLGEIVTGKQEGTVARLIVKDIAKRGDGKPDYDGILMVKRGDTWKIVLNAREVEESPGAATPQERKALAELRKWQDEVMSDLNNRPH